jgi:hypothetical protein
MSKMFLERLRGHHERISRQLEREQKSSNADTLRLGRLKKLKLSLKDRMARVETALGV